MSSSAIDSPEFSIRSQDSILSGESTTITPLAATTGRSFRGGWDIARGATRVCGFEPSRLEDEVGSGGRFFLVASNLEPATVPFRCMNELRSAWRFELLPSISEQVAGIRVFLALNVSETARVLGVERPTVYSWVTSRSHPHPANRDRIGRLYAFARRWSRLGARPMLDWYEDQGGDRERVIEALREPDQARDVFEALRAMWSERPDSQERASVRRSAERLGIRPDVGGQERIDLLTGRRVSNE